MEKITQMYGLLHQRYIFSCLQEATVHPPDVPSHVGCCEQTSKSSQENELPTIVRKLSIHSYIWNSYAVLWQCFSVDLFCVFALSDHRCPIWNLLSVSILPIDCWIICWRTMMSDSPLTVGFAHISVIDISAFILIAGCHDGCPATSAIYSAP